VESCQGSHARILSTLSSLFFWKIALRVRFVRARFLIYNPRVKLLETYISAPYDTSSVSACIHHVYHTCAYVDYSSVLRTIPSRIMDRRGLSRLKKKKGRKRIRIREAKGLRKTDADARSRSLAISNAIRSEAMKVRRK